MSVHLLPSGDKDRDPAPFPRPPPGEQGATAWVLAMAASCEEGNLGMLQKQP